MCDSILLPPLENCEMINHLDDSITLEEMRALVSGKLGELNNFDYTAIANGLPQQLIHQMNVIRPGILTSCDDLNVQLGDAAYALLQPPAKAALKAAIQERGIAMKINSGYRTIAQQQILYNGRFVRDLPVAAPGASNHQSGLALDIQDAPGWRPYLESYGWEWLGHYDPPHFDFYGTGCDYNLGSLAVLAFQQLWNQNNPDQALQEDGQYGPGTERCLNQTQVRGFERPPWENKPRLLRLATPRMEGADVAALQEQLVNNGFTDIEPDGILGPNTDRFVKAFQVRVGLEGDGIVGLKTLTQLRNPETLGDAPAGLEPGGQNGAEVSEEADLETATASDAELETAHDFIPSDPVSSGPVSSDSVPSDSALSDSVLAFPEPAPPLPLSWLRLETPPIESFAVRRLQAALFLADFDIEVNGVFDSVTDEVVKAFQKRTQLADDGVVGPKTIVQLQRIVPSLSLVNDAGMRQKRVADSVNRPIGGFFDRALDFTLRWEGGQVDHANDLGGRTNRGVTQRVFDASRLQQGLEPKDVFEATLEQVREIYFNSYWLPCQGESMVLPLAIAHFDTAVLFGVKGATKFLQEALSLAADGQFGAQTKAALAAKNDQQTAFKIVEGRIDYHRRRVEQNPSQGVFLQGWLNRAEDLRTVVAAASA